MGATPEKSGKTGVLTIRAEASRLRVEGAELVALNSQLPAKAAQEGGGHQAGAAAFAPDHLCPICSEQPSCRVCLHFQPVNL